jgi:uncharacterized integral membrane protein (TIGR00698 family)
MIGSTQWRQTSRTTVETHAPGLALAGAVAVIAWVFGRGEAWLFGSEVVEPLVAALLIGMGVRFFFAPAAAAPGIGFAAKNLLEVAIVLLGLTLDLRRVGHEGPMLEVAVLLSVTVAITGGIALGRLAGLPRKQAILVAVGNAICGNSAIAAVSPAIRAKKHEVASAIALSAILGVGVVLALPLLIPLVGLSHYQYGVLAGLTVYAVPQVLAATIPVSVESGQIGALVKLSRVLLLGPVVAIFAFLHRHEDGNTARIPFSRFVPWFLIGFVLCAVARTSGLVGASLTANSQSASKLLTIVAMAGLGLSVDARAVRQTGGRVALVVAGLLIALVALALSVIFLFGLDD